MARFERYKILKSSDDLDQSILCFTEAMSLPLPWDPRCQNMIQIRFRLTIALVHRANDSKRPEDITRSIIHLRYLREQPLEAFNIPPNRVAGLLLDALGIRVEMKLGDVRQDIEEMAVLCHELLKSDIPTTSLIGFIMGFVRAVNAQFGRFNEQKEPSDKVIECLREANRRLPDSYNVSNSLGVSLYYRFSTTYSNDDYEEGTTILGKVIHAPGDGLIQHKELALRITAAFAQARSSMFGKPEYLEQAIHSTRTLLGEAALEDTLRPTVTYQLALLHGNRFDDSRVASGLQEAHLGNSGISDHQLFRDLTASLTELNVENDHGKHFDAILSIDRIFNQVEVEEAIKYCRRLLASSHPNSDFAHLAGMGLSILLPRAFSCTNKVEYLNEAISVFRAIFNNRLGGANIFVIQGFIASLRRRFELLYLKEDYYEIMQLFPIAVNDERARAPDRFLVSCDWACWARTSGHPCTLTAYDCAISLMQDTLTFAPTLDIQHSRLVAMRDRFEVLPLDYASYLVSMGQLQRAIETLERGRSLIWSEMRSLRTSMDQIRAANTDLADKFAAVNRDLEMLTLKLSPNSIGDSRGGGPGSMDQFGHLVVQQRKLLDDRKKLISQIQALPGFEAFMKLPSFDKLHFAAARGPVIIINHCRWRSDILIILHNSPPSLIPTADDFYDRANNLRDLLLNARKEGLDSNQYEDALSSVLKGLYELVGRPVIQRLDELNVPKQSRIWWCPTSVLCSLPLHAMGPIQSDDNGRPQYFLDLYIPSYIPTLSALIESNKPGSHILDRPSILLVSQPDASLPGAFGEIQVIQAADTQVTTLISAKATPTTVLERLRDHRFIHIVCHGVLEPGKPFDASFKLYRDKRLSLLDIVRSRLPKAEFAFLSACHTAQLTDESIADEALHLAAAMQYCGFRSVVGTMWAMADTDGRFLAGKFYKQVFSSRKNLQGVPYYERTAKALRNAVRNLRRESGMALERWVNFVHYGA